MKAGVRALGVAESFRDERSTLAGVVVRADRVVDGFGFSSCTVGGTDATDAIVELIETLDREDVRYVFLSGLAIAWYNVVDLHRLYEAVGRPVCSVTTGESEGLERPLHEQFDGEALAERLEIYRALPPRRRVEVNERTLYVRAVGLPEDEVSTVLAAFTPAGEGLEPVHVAGLAARAADEWQVRSTDREPNRPESDWPPDEW